MILKTNVILTEKRVQELLPLLLAGDEAAAEELMLGYIRYIRVMLKGKHGGDRYAVGIAAMVEVIRKVQAGHWKKGTTNLTGYMRKFVSGRVQSYTQKDHLIPIEPRAFKGKPNQFLPVSAISRVSVSHHNMVLQRIAVQEALAELTNREQDVLILRSEGLNLVEISDTLSISKSWVHMLEQRALGKMRVLLTEA